MTEKPLLTRSQMSSLAIYFPEGIDFFDEELKKPNIYDHFAASWRLASDSFGYPNIDNCGVNYDRILEEVVKARIEREKRESLERLTKSQVSRTGLPGILSRIQGILFGDDSIPE